jgi:hypothetical protein
MDSACYSDLQLSLVSIRTKYERTRHLQVNTIRKLSIKHNLFNYATSTEGSMSECVSGSVVKGKVLRFLFPR